MPSQTQVTKTKVTREESQQIAEQSAEKQSRSERAEEIMELSDQLLDEIDAILTEERDELVHFRQKGGE